MFDVDIECYNRDMDTLKKVSPPQNDNGRDFCVNMEIKRGRASRGKVDLLLDIHFFVAEKTILLGTVRVGITRGRLELGITNRVLPFKTRKPEIEIPGSLDTKRTESWGREKAEKRGAGAKGDLGADNKIGVSIRGAAESSKGWSEMKTDEVTAAKRLISHGGDETQPFWEFETDGINPTLLGGIRQQELGNVEITGHPCQIKACFRTRKRSLWISGSEGIWPSDMNKSNLAARRLVIRKWLRPIVGGVFESKRNHYLR